MILNIYCFELYILIILTSVSNAKPGVVPLCETIDTVINVILEWHYCSFYSLECSKILEKCLYINRACLLILIMPLYMFIFYQ